MTDQTIREAVEAVKDMLTYLKGDANEKHYKVLVELAQSYLAIDGFPKEKGYGVSSKEHIEHHFHGEAQCFECDENKGYNQSSQEFKLSLLKKLEGLEEVIDKALEQPLPEENITTAQELVIAISQHILGGGE